MAIMPQDNLDIRLAEMYASKVTVNLEAKSSLTPDQFWSSMELIAVNNKAFMNVKRKVA